MRRCGVAPHPPGEPYKDYDGEEACEFEGQRYIIYRVYDREDDVTELYDNAELANVEAYIPEFKSEYSKELSNILMDEGVNQVFEDNADFTPMAKGIPMKIDQICQKTCKRGRNSTARRGCFCVEFRRFGFIKVHLFHSGIIACIFA